MMGAINKEPRSVRDVRRLAEELGVMVEVQNSGTFRGYTVRFSTLGVPRSEWLIPGKGLTWLQGFGSQRQQAVSVALALERLDNQEDRNSADAQREINRMFDALLAMGVQV